MLHLCDAGLKFTKSIIVCHNRQRKRVGIFWGWLSLKARAYADHESEWSRGKFYCSPTVDAKCTYRNLKLIDVRFDIVKMSSSISHVGFTGVLHQGNTRGDLQNKELWCSSKYVSELRMNQKGRCLVFIALDESLGALIVGIVITLIDNLYLLDKWSSYNLKKG